MSLEFAGMSQSRLIFAGAVLAAILSANSRVGADGDVDYINPQFQAAINESPGLAWVLPSGAVVAESRSRNIFVYSSASTIDKASLRATLTPEESLEFAKKNHVACDAQSDEKPPTLSIYDSSIKKFRGNPQVFFTTKPLPGVKTGYQLSTLDETLGKNIWERMQPKSPQQLRAAAVIRRDGVQYFYSLAALYDGPDKGLSRMGMFLQASDGRIVAADVSDVNGEELCDGCGLPTFEDGIERVYAVENMLTAPQFSYPLLIMDTSTAEGRAISLTTVSPDARFYSYRLYEYVVNCN
jgi:hypothetical protein